MKTSPTNTNLPPSPSLMERGMNSDDSRKKGVRIVTLILLAVLLFFFKLGSFSLYDAAETTYGEFVKGILQTGDWLTMHFNGQIIFDKPPLYFWLVALLAKLMGLNEWTMRFFAALSGVATVVATFLLGKKFYNKRTGFFSAIIVMTAFQFLIQSRIAELDIVLTLLMTISLLCFYQGYVSGNRRYFLLMGIPLGLGMLIKGLLAAALPACAIFLFLLFKKELHKLLDIHVLLGILVILTIGLPWYIAEYLIHGKVFLNFALGFLFLSRFGSVVCGHTGPWYYYFFALILGFAPWSQFLPYAFFQAAKYWKNDPELLCLCFIIPALLVFSIAKTKLPNYILPLYPFLAIMIGKLWDDFLSTGIETMRKGMIIANILLAVVVILLMIAGVIAGSQYSGPYQEMLPQLYLLAGILTTGSILSIALFFTKNYYASFFSIPIMVFIITGFLITQTLPAVEAYKGTKELAQAVSQVIKNNESIAAYEIGNRPGVIFYNVRPIVFLKNQQEVYNFIKKKKGYCFTTTTEYEKNLKKYSRVFKKKGELIVLY